MQFDLLQLVGKMLRIQSFRLQGTFPPLLYAYFYAINIYSANSLFALYVLPLSIDRCPFVFSPDIPSTSWWSFCGEW